MNRTSPLPNGGFRRIVRAPFAGKTLIANTLALGFVQGVNYIFPLLLIPYLMRVLGPAGWGLAL